MLVLTQKRGEAVLIGSNIRVTVLDITQHGQVRLGFEAPKEVNILRDKVAKRLQAEGKEVYTEKAHESQGDSNNSAS